MIKTFKRVERTGRLTAERIICRVRKALILVISYIVSIMMNTLKA